MNLSGHRNSDVGVKRKQRIRPTRPGVRGAFGISALLLIASVLVFCIATGFAQQSPTINYDSKKPIRIAADRLEADNTLRSVRFIGNVVAVQDQAVLHADLIVLRYTGASENEDSDKSKGILEAMPGRQGGAIDSLVATGRVTLIHKNRKAVCSQALYKEASRTITLTGEPKLWQGMDYLSGSKIVLNLESEKVQVTGRGTSRVNAQIMPGSTPPMLNDKAKVRLEDLMGKPAPLPGEVPDDATGNQKASEQ